MQTNIDLEDQALEELRQLRMEMGAENYDEVLHKLFAMHRKGSRPIKGLTPGIGPYSRE